MRKLLLSIGAIITLLLGAVFVYDNFFAPDPCEEYESVFDMAYKPVIYLYPEEKTNVEVKLDYKGKLLCTYPHYDSSWKVTAYPDGTLIDPTSGNEYSYLFWEGVYDYDLTLDEGFVVSGNETATFLRNVLSDMGLTPREYNEFIVFWLPQMQNNPYNLITFQHEAYTESAPLNIVPAPDSMLRVFMAYKPLEEPIDVVEPTITPFDRKGFAVIEWGGTKIN